MHYKRFVSDECLNLLEPGGALAHLVASTQAPWDGGAFPDLQLRRDDTVMLYAGLTRPLRVCRLKKSGAIRFSADKFYECQSCGMAWGERLEPIRSEAQVGVDLKGYLESVELPPSALAKEGRAQNWLSRRYGVGRLAADEWVAIDREVVIGYQDEGERENIWGPIRDWAKEVAKRLQHDSEYSGKYGVALEDKVIGQELDLLLWDPASQCFWVTEVKDGSSAKGVYLSPLQVAAYTAIWRIFARDYPADALNGISRLVDQKKRLGLIAEGVELPEALLPGMFRPLVVVQKPNSCSTCWARLQEVMSLVQSVEDDLECGPIIGNLPVWQLSDERLTSLDGTWQRWALGEIAASEV